jgi:hypothetical protein
MDPKTIETMLTIAMQAGTTLAGVVLQAQMTGDVATLDALARVLPTSEILAARDEATRQAQRAKAAAELRP